MDTIKRKVFIVTAYYDGDKEPVISLDDDENWDRPDSLFLNDAIEVTMKNYNPDSNIFDVCIDDAKPALFSMGRWWSKWMYRLLRR